MNQLRTAMGHLMSIRKKLPDPAPPDAAGGWAVAILPFLDEKTLWEQLANNPSVQSVVPVSSRRPLVMTCPVAWEGDSSVLAFQRAIIRWTLTQSTPVSPVSEMFH